MTGGATITRNVIVPNATGVHARPAAAFVKAAAAFDSRVTISKDGREADGKSIIGILTLAAERGCTLRVSANGDDAEAAVNALVALVEGGFCEER